MILRGKLDAKLLKSNVHVSFYVFHSKFVEHYIPQKNPEIQIFKLFGAFNWY
jgi:hypothetical protein